MSSRFASLGLGVLCALFTIYTLFSHITSWRDIDSADLFIALALAITTGAGHFAIDTHLKLERFFFTLIFAIGVSLCVGISAGRTTAMWQRSADDRMNTDTTFQAQVAQAEQARLRSKDARDVAMKKVEDASDAVTVACKSGDGPTCKGARSTLTTQQQLLDMRKTDYKEADTLFWDLKGNHTSRQSSEQKLRNFVLLWSKMRGIPEAEAEPVVMTVLPFALTIMFELGSIVFTMRAFRHVAPLAQASPTDHAVTLTQIARDLSISPAQARAHMRAIGYPKPIHGWSFTQIEAQTIKSRLSTLH